MRLHHCLLAVLLATGCAPTLHLTRPTPPEATFGSVRTLSVDVSTATGKAIENAVITGIVLGEVPIPVPLDAAVRLSLVQALQALGYNVCPAAPCGEGAMNVVLTESAVNTEWHRNGRQTNVRVTARVKVRQHDGQEPYDFTFWARRSGRSEHAPALVKEASDAIAERMQATLLPGRMRSSIPLEDGGPLTPGVNMLLSSNWNGAVTYFTQLTQQQPDLAGAWYDLGVAWQAYGDWTQALAAYEQAAARERKDTFIDAANFARRQAPAVQPLQVPAQPQPQPQAQ